MKKFIVLTADEDGEYHLHYMTADEIKKDYLSDDGSPTPVFNELPELGYCGRGILIIDGKIVIPKPIEVVKDWEL